MKKFILMTLCVIMTLSFAACSSKTSTANDESAQIPNPFIDCESIEAAEKLAGFEVVIPETIPEGYVQTSIRVIENELVEVNFENGEKEICFRKAKGSEDISGDYNKYEEENIIEADKFKISVKGNDGTVNVATWTDDEYSYAICVNSGEDGIDSSTIVDIINSIQ